MTEQEQKLAFAKRYRDDRSDPLPIVLSVMPFGTDPVAIHNAMQQWPHDPIVVGEIERLSKILPEKETIAHQLLYKANNPAIAPEDQVKFYKLYCDLIYPSKSGSLKSDSGGDRLDEFIEALTCPLPAKVD